MNGRDLFAKADKQVRALKERIATLHQSLRAFERHRQQAFERMEAKREAEEDWNR